MYTDISHRPEPAVLVGRRALLNRLEDQDNTNKYIAFQKNILNPRAGLNYICINSQIITLYV